MATAFDTLAISRSIRDAGVDERAAEAITHAIAAAISREREELATKADLLAIRSDLALMEQRLTTKVSELHNRTLTVMFGFLLGFGSLIVAAIKLL